MLETLLTNFHTLLCCQDDKKVACVFLLVHSGVAVADKLLAKWHDSDLRNALYPFPTNGIDSDLERPSSIDMHRHREESHLQSPSDILVTNHCRQRFLTLDFVLPVQEL